MLSFVDQIGNHYEILIFIIVGLISIFLVFIALKFSNKRKKLEVRGRNLITGLPDSIEITQDETEEALRECVQKIIKGTTNVLEDTPPELSADIYGKGIILTGGGALLNGLSELLEETLNVPVLTAESPLTCVVEGTGVLLENIKLLEENQ